MEFFSFAVGNEEDMLVVDTQPITQIHICEEKENLEPSKKKRKVSEDPVQALKLKMIQNEIDCRKKEHDFEMAMMKEEHKMKMKILDLKLAKAGKENC